MDKEIRVSTKSSRGRGWRIHKRPDQQFYVPGALHCKKQEQNTVNNDKNLKLIEKSARSVETSIKDIERTAHKQNIVSSDRNLTEESGRSLGTSINDNESTTQEQNTISSYKDLTEQSTSSSETSISDAQSITPDQYTLNSDTNLTEQAARSVKTSINDIHCQAQKQNDVKSDNSLTEQSGRSVKTPINDNQRTTQEKSSAEAIENLSDKSEDLKKTLLGQEEELVCRQFKSTLPDHLDINVKVSSGLTQCGHNKGAAKEKEEILACHSVAVLLESEVMLKKLNHSHHKGNDMNTNADISKTEADSPCQSLAVPADLEMESKTANQNHEIVCGQGANEDFGKQSINSFDQLISCNHLNTQQLILSKSASSHPGNSNRQYDKVDTSLSPPKAKQLLNSSCEELPTLNDSNEDVSDSNTKLDKAKKKKKKKKLEHVESKGSKKKKKDKKEYVEGSKDVDYKSKDDKFKSKVQVKEKEKGRWKDDSLEKDQVLEDEHHDDDHYDSWLTKFNDDGECLDPELIKELSKVMGIKKPVKHKTQFDFYSLAEKDIELDDGYGHIVEIYDFSPDLKTQDLTKSLNMFRNQGYEIKWVDDTHALAAFSSPLAANQAIKMCSSPLLKLRPVSQGIAESKKRAKRCFEFLQPYKPRPQTTKLTAHMLVTGALGVKSHLSKEEKQKEKDKLKKAREQKRQEKQRKADIWGD